MNIRTTQSVSTRIYKINWMVKKEIKKEKVTNCFKINWMVKKEIKN